MIVLLEDFGVGFVLVMYDLEICGVGELFGEEQSGLMEIIGFLLYMELLENVVDVLKVGCELLLEDFISY